MVTTISQDTIEIVEFFRERFQNLYGNGHYILACHAAFPIALTPNLLYQLWANFRTYTDNKNKQTIHSIAVSDLLLSNLCQEVSREVFEMNVEVRAYLLNQLESVFRFGNKRMKKLGYFLYQYTQEVAISRHPKSFVDAQTWTALATIAPQKAANELQEALSKAILEKDNSEIIRMRSILEAYANQEPAFENLLHYSMGLKAAILDFPRKVIQDQFNKANTRTLVLTEGATIDKGVLEIPFLEELEGKVEIEQEIITTPVAKARTLIEQEKEQLTGKLNLKGLQLKKIPTEVFSLTHLKSLDLYDNLIEAIPVSITNLNKLEELRSSKNSIKHLPNDLSELTGLKKIKLDDCQLEEFPKVFFQMPRLENISLENNQIDFLPPEVGDLDNLKSLDVRGNSIVNIPKTLFKLTGQAFRDHFKGLKSYKTDKKVFLLLTNDVEKKFDGIQQEIRYLKDIFNSNKNLHNDMELIVEEFSNYLELFEICYKYQDQIFLAHFASANILYLTGKSKKLRIKPITLNRLLNKLPNCSLIIFNDVYTKDIAIEISKNQQFPF